MNAEPARNSGQEAQKLATPWSSVSESPKALPI